MKSVGALILIGLLNTLLQSPFCEGGCPQACTKNLDPVCGESLTNGARETFPNYCEFVKRQCEEPDLKWALISEGPCSSYY